MPPLWPAGASLPRYLAITPPADMSDSAWLEVLARQIQCLSAQFTAPVALQLRPARALPMSVWASAQAAATAAGFFVWINAEWSVAHALRAGAVHLTQARLRQTARATVRAFQAAGGQVSAACHDASSLAQAAAVGVDAVLISPVLPTASHPGAPVLGWTGFATLAQAACQPVYALGGVGPADLPAVRAKGGYGVAGIGAFGGLTPAESPS